MSITSSIEPDHTLTVFKGTGTISFDEITEAMKHFYGGKPTLNVLWDLTDATEIPLTSEEVQRIASMPPRYNGSKRPAGKTAIVVDDDFFFGLARMFEIHGTVNQLPHSVQIFRELTSARKWIESGSPDVP